jgi:undecaprenyl diphosphate synthase
VDVLIYRAYEWALIRRIMTLPAHICFMITEEDLFSAPEKLAEVSRWCTEINTAALKQSSVDGQALLEHYNGIRTLTFHISTADPRRVRSVLDNIRTISSYARLTIHLGEITEVSGEGLDVVVAVGKSGRDEIVDCIRGMARDQILPEEVDEQTFERYLTFHYTPDMVIKSGGYHLTDFLIWQSVYSELFFSDVNWKYFRRIDLIRALRDYQSRRRRFGK